MNLEKARLEQALEIRKNKKNKKPDFLRQDAHRVSKLRKCWKQPKGMHSKMRLKFRSYRKQPSMGYSSPKLVRGLHPTGLKEIVVRTINDLNRLDPKTQGVTIGRVGLRKKVAILKKAMELNLTILNIKDTNNFLEKIKQHFEQKNQKKKEQTSQKQNKQEENIKQYKEKEEKKKEKEEVSEIEEKIAEETKKGMKSEKIKILEKKQ